MNYTAEDFHLQYISTYSLYVQSDVIYDHLVVVDKDKQVLAYVKYDNIAPSPEAIRLLSLPFAQVYVNIPHQDLVWVPSEVYDQGDKAMYLDHFADGDLSTILETEIVRIGATALFQLDLLVMSRWRKLYPNALFLPNFKFVLQQAISQVLPQGTTLGVHKYDNQADIFLFIDGELRIYNTFEVETVDDLSYFVLSIFKNFDLNAQVDRILLSGCTRDSEEAVRLSLYTQHVQLLSSQVNWTVEQVWLEKELESLNVLKDSGLCV